MGNRSPLHISWHRHTVFYPAFDHKLYKTSHITSIAKNNLGVIIYIDDAPVSSASAGVSNGMGIATSSRGAGSNMASGVA